MNRQIAHQYFDWLCGLVESDRKSYRRLFEHLHHTEFTYILMEDENRYDDGRDLRVTFADEVGLSVVSYALDGPCSVFEMMVALAHRCEEHITCDPDLGDRTAEWFWLMIENLGLLDMDDDNYDAAVVDHSLYILLNRKYSPDGRGGLFVIKDYKYDLREIEIWYQLNWYLDSIL